MGNDPLISKTPQVQIRINGVPIRIFIDTGASVNIIDEEAFAQVNHQNIIALESTNKHLFPNLS